MEIIKLDPRQKKRASEVVAAAFFDYPMFTFYFPDPKKRARILPWYLGNVLNCALRYGEVYTTAEISGVIFTLPPGHTKISQSEYIQNGFLLTPLLLGFRAYVRSQECEKLVADTHEKIMDDRPHYYLWGLTVDPSQKRKGIGTALLRPVIEKADAKKSQFTWKRMTKKMSRTIKGWVFPWFAQTCFQNSILQFGACCGSQSKRCARVVKWQSESKSHPLKRSPSPLPRGPSCKYG